MHGEGGFNLTKFMCNRKVVLQSVPGCHRRSRVQNADLDGRLPVKRTLGIYWDIDKNLTKPDTYEVTRCYKSCGFGKVKEF